MDKLSVLLVSNRILLVFHKCLYLFHQYIFAELHSTFPYVSLFTCFTCTSQEILGYYEILRAEFPEADIRASTLENYFAMVQPIRSQLPLVTMEIGDTWMVGVPSDPRKNAEFRATARVLGKCIDMGLYLN
jgi:hypothetical protein